MRNRYSSAPDPEWQRTVALRRVKDLVTAYERQDRLADFGNPLRHLQLRKIFGIVAEYVGATSIEVEQWCIESPDSLIPRDPEGEGGAA